MMANHLRLGGQVLGVLAVKITRARRDAGLTQQQIADVLDVRRVSISDMERGRVAVSAWYVCQLAILTDKSINWFFEGLV